MHQHMQKKIKQHLQLQKKNIDEKKNYIANCGNQQCTMTGSIKKLCWYQVKTLPVLIR